MSKISQADATATHVEVSVDEADRVTVRLVHIDADDRETLISQTTTRLPGIWATTPDAEGTQGAVRAAGLAPDFERTLRGTFAVVDGAETFSIQGPVI